MASPQTAAADHGSAAHSHHPPAIMYYQIYGVLMVLLILTVLMYYVDLQERFHIIGLNLIVAMAIAVPKAALVVLYFMGVKYSTKLTWLWAAVGFLWLFIMAGIFIDYQTRAWNAVPGWQLGR